MSVKSGSPKWCLAFFPIRRMIRIDDNDGIIIFLKPPSKRQVSLEIFLFMVAVFQHQHMRKLEDQVNGVCKRMEDKLKELEKK